MRIVSDPVRLLILLPSASSLDEPRIVLLLGSLLEEEDWEIFLVFFDLLGNVEVKVGHIAIAVQRLLALLLLVLWLFGVWFGFFLFDGGVLVHLFLGQLALAHDLHLTFLSFFGLGDRRRLLVRNSIEVVVVGRIEKRIFALILNSAANRIDEPLSIHFSPGLDSRELVVAAMSGITNPYSILLLLLMLLFHVLLSHDLRQLIGELGWLLCLVH